jgi:hypothetical protein
MEPNFFSSANATVKIDMTVREDCFFPIYFFRYSDSNTEFMERFSQ